MSKAGFHPGISGYFLFLLRLILINLYRLHFPFSAISKRISQKKNKTEVFYTSNLIHFWKCSESNSRNSVLQKYCVSSKQWKCWCFLRNIITFPGSTKAALHSNRMKCSQFHLLKHSQLFFEDSWLNCIKKPTQYPFLVSTLS